MGAPGEGAVDSTQKIEILRGAIANLQEQQRSIGLRATGSDLKDEKASAETKAATAREAQRLATELGESSERQIRAIEEVMKQRERDQDSLNEWARRYHDTIARVKVESDRLQNSLNKAGIEEARDSMKRLVEEQKKLYEPRPEIPQLPIEVPTSQRLAGTTPPGQLSRFIRPEDRASSRIRQR